MRLGLCCQFANEPIKFKITTALACKKLSREARLAKISALCVNNAQSLEQAILYCENHHIGAFRVLSQLWPLKTHPECGYQLAELPEVEQIVAQLLKCRELARQSHVRLSFHPDQYVVLNSPRDEVVASSLAELEYQSEAAELIGADVVNIHGGGAYGDKPDALARFRQNLQRLSPRARALITLENDDKIYSPADLLPICEAEQIPLCYDVHHHRCLRDELSVEEATTSAIQTWAADRQQAREPLFHISSPLNGWHNPQPQLHHDYIDPADVPSTWLHLPIAVDIEAKAKELAINKLQAWLATSAIAGEVVSSKRARTY
ncbi:UV DNA damage endonuclease [Anatilimnocola aggregata]|uniref:UV DNA damage endonuclease n=1 Tax=Anatilimnocola aggregata TaxID=2528021 RepID=A0A517YJD3_9BACT|nr:UV DNA damage repair endonuclease UvsE [Anatilimnocola aggregata]QDU30327.1 UV DNA damage endonuclease [Anatilimnocola aggregata]